MKVKLDENLGDRTLLFFSSRGHDAETVLKEGMQGCSDEELFSACCKEGRCLVTLDLDFSDVTRFPPAKSGGLVVFRVPRNPSASCLERLAGQFLDTPGLESPVGKLFIVEVGRIRIHDS